MTGHFTIGYQGNGPVRIDAQLYRWRFTFLCLAWRWRGQWHHRHLPRKAGEVA